MLNRLAGGSVLSRSIKSLILSFHCCQCFQCFTLQCLLFPLISLDETATHLLLRLVPSLEPIGCIRGTYHAPADKQPYYKLSRLVVLENYRAHRLGRELILALHAWVLGDAVSHGLKSSNTVPVVCHSQMYVKKFYARYERTY